MKKYVLLKCTNANRIGVMTEDSIEKILSELAQLNPNVDLSYKLYHEDEKVAYYEFINLPQYVLKLYKNYGG